MQNANLTGHVACPDFLNDASKYDMSYHICNGSMQHFIYYSMLQTPTAFVTFTILYLIYSLGELNLDNKWQSDDLAVR